MLLITGLLPSCLAAVRDVKMSSFSTLKPACLSLDANESRFSLDVFVTNWIGIFRPRTRDMASWTPGSNLSSTCTVPDRSNINPEILLPLIIMPHTCNLDVILLYWADNVHVHGIKTSLFFDWSHFIYTRFDCSLAKIKCRALWLILENILQFLLICYVV